MTLNSIRKRIVEYLPQLWNSVGAEEFSVSNKSSYKDIVTSVDIAIEDRLKGFLGKLLPPADYLGEESTSSVRSSLMWIVDPVDGTTNFSKSNPHYCTQIALFREGRVVMGITYDHNRRETFHAIEGQGAYLNNRRIWVSKVGDLREASSHVGLQYSSQLSSERVLKRMDRAIHECRAVRITGSACLDLAYVASGRADVFWEESLKPWDVASGTLLVKEAGGLISSCLETEFNLFEPDILATNASRELRNQFLRSILFPDQVKNAL